MAAYRSFFPNQQPHQISTVLSEMASPFRCARARQTLNFQKVICKIVYNILMEKLSVEAIFSFTLDLSFSFVDDVLKRFSVPWKFLFLKPLLHVYLCCFCCEALNRVHEKITGSIVCRVMFDANAREGSRVQVQSQMLGLFGFVFVELEFQGGIDTSNF